MVLIVVLPPTQRPPISATGPSPGSPAGTRTASGHQKSWPALASQRMNSAAV